jgi:tetratricopeptide (TPR) repeat protein
MDLLIRLGQADKALEDLPSILQEMKNWADAPASGEAHVLGLLAEAYRAKGDYKKAAKYFTDALSSLQAHDAMDENPIFLYSLSTVLLQDDDVYGEVRTIRALAKRRASTRTTYHAFSTWLRFRQR